MTGRLYIIGTPIGNLADMTPRATETLRGLDVLYCEDTRVTGKLLQLLGLSGVELRALSDDAPAGRYGDAVAEVRSGRAVGFSADAGMPGISDPARRLTRAAWDGGVTPLVIPGVSALPTLLAACPFLANSFRFAGFAPRKGGERAQFAAELRDSDEPTVFFESPRRVHGLLDELCAALEPERELLIGRELTKLHEQLVLLKAEQWPELRAGVPELGEFTLVVAGRPEQRREPDAEAAHAALVRLREAGFSSRDAARALAAALDLAPNQVKKLGY